MGSQQEDRLAVNFTMEGNFTFDWFSGQTFKADMWHWKAARSNPAGLAHDQMIIISNQPSAGAFMATAKDHSTIYIMRPNDEGDELYATRHYEVKDKEMMPRYILAESPGGSIADVKAKGRWGDGIWTLEESRKLDTGNADDVAFKPDSDIASAIAVYDHSGNDHHNYSETVVFQIREQQCLLIKESLSSFPISLGLGKKST